MHALSDTAAVAFGLTSVSTASPNPTAWKHADGDVLVSSWFRCSSMPSATSTAAGKFSSLQTCTTSMLAHMLTAVKPIIAAV